MHRQMAKRRKVGKRKATEGTFGLGEKDFPKGGSAGQECATRAANCWNLIPQGLLQRFLHNADGNRWKLWKWWKWVGGKYEVGVAFRIWSGRHKAESLFCIDKLPAPVAPRPFQNISLGQDSFSLWRSSMKRRNFYQRVKKIIIIRHVYAIQTQPL